MDLSGLARGLFGHRDDRPMPEEVTDPYAFLAGVQGRVPINLARLRHVSTVAGRVARIQPEERGKPTQFVVELEDNSGPRLELVWLGRSSLPGVVRGAALVASGTISVSKGRRRMLDPSYTLIGGA